MQDVGFHFHSIDGVYWDESACYRLSRDEVDQLEDASAELHRLCMAAAGEVIGKRRYAEFAIPDAAVGLIERSWRAGEPTLFGRFDLAWDGQGPPKLLEYNADTPTALIEASIAQWYWMNAVRPGADQFNSLHEKLIARWRSIAADKNLTDLHLTCMGESEEDVGNLDYMADVAMQAGLTPHFIDIGRIGWSAAGKRFVDEADRPIAALFKLYPWEWMVREEFGAHVASSDTLIIEPAWKMILSNKAILPVLWELFPDHPNLLPAAREPGRITGAVVKKPLLSREGANISLSATDRDCATDGPYGAEGFVWQRYHAIPDLSGTGGNHMVIGAWMVGDEPAGIGIREDATVITRDTSRFVPHYFE